MEHDMEFWHNLLEEILNQGGYRFREISCGGEAACEESCTGHYRVIKTTYVVDVRFIIHRRGFDDVPTMCIEHPNNIITIDFNNLSDPGTLSDEHIKKIHNAIDTGFYEE